MTKEELQRFEELRAILNPIKRFERLDIDIVTMSKEEVSALLDSHHVHSQHLAKIPTEFLKDRNFALRFLDQPLLREERVNEAVQHFEHERDFLIESIRQPHSQADYIFRGLSESYRNDKEIAYYALTRQATNIKYIEPELSNDLASQGFSIQTQLNIGHGFEKIFPVLDHLGSELGLTDHFIPKEYDPLEALYRKEASISGHFENDLISQLTNCTEFTKSDLSKIKVPLLVDNTKLLMIFDQGLRENEETQLTNISIATFDSKTFSDITIPTYKPLELTIPDVIEHFKMTESSIDLTRLEKCNSELHKQVKTTLNYLKLQAELMEKLVQQKETGHSQTRERKMKI